MYIRYQGFKSWLRWGIAASLLAFLAACSTASSTDPSSTNGYVLTVNVATGDSQESVSQQYGGKILAWMGDKAILKLSNQAYADLQRKGVSVQATTNGTLTAPEATLQGWNAWAGGWNAWAGGWNAWAGGWNAWAGGMTPPAPPSDNASVWLSINMNTAMQYSTKFGQGIKVAVIDTGIDTAHPIFVGRLAPSAEWKDFVDGDTNPQEVGSSADRGYGHGTAVAGLILQIAPKATILPIRVLDQNGTGSLDNVIAAINHAITMGAQIINISLGSYTSYQPLTDVINFAASKKVIVVASSGNDGSETSTFPAQLAVTANNPYLYSVGSINTSGSLSGFSNYGGTMSIYAPGESIVTAYPGSQITQATGTSFAAPLTAGTLALAWSEYPFTDPANLNMYARNTAYIPYDRYTPRKPSQFGNLRADLLVGSAGGLPGFNFNANPYFYDAFANTVSTWGWTKTASVRTATTNCGRYLNEGCQEIVGAGSISQVVTGLRPNTTYVLAGELRVTSSSKPAVLGVKNYGGITKELTVSSTMSSGLSLTFTTGSANTSAEIYYSKTTTTGNAQTQNITLQRQ